MMSKYKPLIIIVSLLLGVSAINAAETLTDEQIKQKIDNSLNQSQEGLVSITHADGTVSRDLKGRFQLFSKVVLDKNGNQKYVCNEHPELDFATHTHNEDAVAKKSTTELKKVAR